MSQVQGIEDLGIFHVQGQPNLNINVDREKAGRFGLNTGDVNTVVQAALAGTTSTTLPSGRAIASSASSFAFRRNIVSRLKPWAM